MILLSVDVALFALSVSVAHHAPNARWFMPRHVSCNTSGTASALFDKDAAAVSDRLVLDTSAWTFPEGFTQMIVPRIYMEAGAAGAQHSVFYDEVRIDGAPQRVLPSLSLKHGEYRTDEFLLRGYMRPPKNVSIVLKRTGKSPVWARLRCVYMFVTGTFGGAATTGTTGVTTAVTTGNASSSSTTGDSSTNSSEEEGGELLNPDIYGTWKSDGAQRILSSSTFPLALLVGAATLGMLAGIIAWIVVAVTKKPARQIEDDDGALESDLLVKESSIGSKVGNHTWEYGNGHRCLIPSTEGRRRGPCVWKTPNRCRKMMALRSDNLSPVSGFVLPSGDPVFFHHASVSPLIDHLEAVANFDRAMEIFRATLHGLEFLHQNQFYHGELTLDTLLLTEDGTVQVTGYAEKQAPLHTWRAPEWDPPDCRTLTLPNEFTDVWDAAWTVYQIFSRGRGPCSWDAERHSFFVALEETPERYDITKIANESERAMEILAECWNTRTPTQRGSPRDVLDALDRIEKSFFYRVSVS